MKVGDLVKHKTASLGIGITKIEVRRSVPSNRMITWAYLLGEQCRVKEDHLEVLNESR